MKGQKSVLSFFSKTDRPQRAAAKQVASYAEEESYAELDQYLEGSRPTKKKKGRLSKPSPSPRNVSKDRESTTTRVFNFEGLFDGNWYACYIEKRMSEYMDPRYRVVWEDDTFGILKQNQLRPIEGMGGQFPTAEEERSRKRKEVATQARSRLKKRKVDILTEDQSEEDESSSSEASSYNMSSEASEDSEPEDSESEFFEEKPFIKKSAKRKSKSSSSRSKGVPSGSAKYGGGKVLLSNDLVASIRKRSQKETAARAKENNDRKKKRSEWLKRHGAKSVVDGDESKFFDPCLMEGDINMAPPQVLKKQLMKMLPLLEGALDHDDFPKTLRLQTACSGTDAPAIALQMCCEMLEDIRGTPLFTVDHVMSCEIEPFKQAYIARNFEGVKLFADVKDLALGNEHAPTAFGGRAKIPAGDMLVAGTVCKDFSGLRTSSRKDHLENKGASGETFCAVVEFLFDKQPKFAIFENVQNAPWAHMKRYIEGRLPLWGLGEKMQVAKKGGTKKSREASDDEDEDDGMKSILDQVFFKVTNGEWVVDSLDASCKIGARLGAVVNGFLKGYDQQEFHKLEKRHKKAEDTVLGLSGLIELLGLNIAEDQLSFETPVKYRCHYKKVDTKLYGLPQVRNRRYMFVYQEKEFCDVKVGGPGNIGRLWEELLEVLEDPVVYSLTSFLPKANDARVRRFREVLRGPIGKKTAIRLAQSDTYSSGQSADKKYATQVRSGTGKYGNKKFHLLPEAKPLTNWGRHGKMSHRLYKSWPELLSLFDARQRDMIDIFGGACANLMPPRDALHNGFFWDISQNVHMASIKTASPGVASCLTPGGWSYLPHLGRTLTGTEKLLFQGIPVDRLQLGQETEVQLSDLSGNAMSLTVVSAAMLAALCVKQFAREREKNRNYHVSEPLDVKSASGVLRGKPQQNHSSDDGDKKCNQMFLDLASLSSEAYFSSILCVCETSGGKSNESILSCADCSLSFCRGCCNTQVDLSCHKMEKLSMAYVDPVDFEQKLWSVVEPALSFQVPESKRYDFMLKNIDRDEKGKWECVYMARDEDSRPVADLRIQVGLLKFGSKECGVKGLIRQFPDNTRGVIDPKWRFVLAAKDVRVRSKTDLVQWEVRSEARRSNVKLVSASDERTPSFRTQMGVFKENKQFNWKEPGKDWKLYKEWPKHIKLGGGGMASLQNQYLRDNTSVFERQSCIASIAQNILYKSSSGYFIYLRPDVDCIDDDDLVLSTSPAYSDLDEVCIVFQGLRLDDVLHPRKQAVTQKKLFAPADATEECISEVIWTQACVEMFTVTESGILVTREPAEIRGSKNINDTHVASVSGLTTSEIEFISQPTLDALKRQGQRLGKITAVDELTLKLDKLGQTSSVTEKRFASLLNPALLRFGSKQKTEGLFSDSDEHFKAFSSYEPWGYDPVHVPSRPEPTWSRVKKGKGKIFYEPAYDPQQSNAFEKALGSRPTAWQIQVVLGKEVQIRAKPSVVAHRAAAALLEGRHPMSVTQNQERFSILWKMAQPDKNIPNVPSAFSIPTSEEYKQAQDASIWDPSLPLYPRQKRALGRMQAIEKELVSFWEEERREFAMPGVGWLLQSKASLKTCLRGGVLGDVMGGGKTATTIALIAQSVEERKKQNDQSPEDCKNYSNASLVLVPDNLIGSWLCEIKKFTGNKLNVVHIDDHAQLMKYSKRELCNVDVVIASMEVLCKPHYIENLKKRSGNNDLPDTTPRFLGQKATESLVGIWVPGHPAAPYAGTDGNQEKRNASAYFTAHYKKAVRALRQKDFDVSAKGLPLEYFQWERLVYDECHEATCPGAGEVGEQDTKVSSHKGPLAAREIMGVASMNMGERPLTCRKGVWGLTGTPMLSTLERTTELASMCGGTYVCGAAKHWRIMERASGRDLFLEDLDTHFFSSGEYRSRCHDHAQDYIQKAVQRNRTSEYTGTKSDHVVSVNMTEETATKVKKLKKELEADKRSAVGNSINIDLAVSKPVAWKKALDIFSADESRGEAVVKCIENLNREDTDSKIVVFAPKDYGAFDLALGLFRKYFVEGAKQHDQEVLGRVNFDYIDDDKSAEIRREIIKRFSNRDTLASDKNNPRVLLLPFSHAAGHNFQYVGRDVVLFAPLWSSVDPVEAIAKEQQAIGRMFRSGQEREVRVHRFLLKNEFSKESIEHEIYEQNNAIENIEAACSS